LVMAIANLCFIMESHLEEVDMLVTSLCFNMAWMHVYSSQLFC